MPPPLPRAAFTAYRLVMTERENGPAALEEFTETPSRVLCVAAHPDDIEYGAAAAVHRWVQAGALATYYLLTRGEAGIDSMAPDLAGPAREQEERDAAAVVGVDIVDFGDWHDGVVEYGLDLRRDIAREVRRRRPDLVFTGSFEPRWPGGPPNQADHRAVGLATMDAVADAGNRWIFPELLAEGLEPWHVRWLAFGGSSVPTHYVDVTGHLDVAVASLETHAAYNDALPEDFPRPPKLLQMILGGGGKAVGVDHALVIDLVTR